MFYSSNYAKHFTPKEKGWYIQYSTESGDRDAIKVEREPIDKEDALNILMNLNPDELWIVDFWSEVK